MRALILSVVLAAVLGACGYKGPLYLPKPKPETGSAQPPAQPAQKPESQGPASQ